LNPREPPWKRADDSGNLPRARGRGARDRAIDKRRITVIERVPASGSCTRCLRSLGLASVKRADKWYGAVACAEGRECPFDSRDPAVAEPALYPRPRRFFARRDPKELNR